MAACEGLIGARVDAASGGHVSTSGAVLMDGEVGPDSVVWMLLPLGSSAHVFVLALRLWPGEAPVLWLASPSVLLTCDGPILTGVLKQQNGRMG